MQMRTATTMRIIFPMNWEMISRKRMLKKDTNQRKYGAGRGLVKALNVIPFLIKAFFRVAFRCNQETSAAWTG